MSTVVKDLGAATAYGYAVEKGYTGTEEEFAELMASYATVGQTAVTAAQTATTKASEAATSATTATTKASEATTAATTATNKAAEAQADADAAALDASQALSAASTATSKATEATTAAATAVSAKDDAVSANTAAQSAKTAAQTAQAGAETAAASVQSSAAQIQTNADDISELKEDLSTFTGNSKITGWIDGWFVSTNGSTYNPSAPVANASFRYVTVECSEGDVFTINGTGGGNPRLWAFADSSNNILSNAGNDATGSNIVIVAPHNATQLIINDKAKTADSYYGDLIINRVDEAEAKLTAVENTPIIKDNFRIGNIDISSEGWTYSTRSTRVTTAIGLSFFLKRGDVIGLSDYTDKRFYIGWKRANGTYGVKGWNTSDVTVTEDGLYVINMTKVPETTVNDVTELTDYLFIKSASGLASSAAYANCLPKVNLNDHFSTLLLGRGQYVDYDSVNGTITIPNDTIYIGSEGGEMFAHVINNTAQIVIQNVTVSAVGATACKLLLNTKTWEFVIKPWSFGYYDDRDPYKYRLIANIRLKTGSYPGSISSPTPWSIDGKPYGISLAGYSRDFIVKSVNHRGWNTAPENTLVAFKESAKHAYKYVECDVHFTSDSVAVLLHDGTINRTARDASGDELSSTVNIADITYEQALTYDFGIYKGSAYAGTRIPTFAEFLTLCRNLSLHPYVELKVGTQAQIESLVSAVKQNGMNGNVTWISFSSSLLAYVVGADSGARVGLLSNSVTSDTITYANTLKTSTNEVFIDSGGYTTAEVELCANADLPLEVWTINNESTALALPSYVTGVTTDSLNVGDILMTNAIA